MAPYSVSICNVTPAFIASAWKNSRTSSASKLPIFGVGIRPEHEERSAGDVDRDAGQRLVHRQQAVGPAGDAALVAERLAQGLAERDADVLDGVVIVDVQVALGANVHVDQRMARQLIQHMVEETNAGREFRCARAVEVDFDLDRSLVGLAR